MQDQSYFLAANCSNDNFNADCDFTVVTLTRPLLELLNKTKRAFAEAQKVVNISTLEVIDWGASFISRTTAEQTLDEVVFKQMEEEVTKGNPFLIPFHPMYALGATEAPADYLVITDRGVWWRAYPKHTDITVQSGQIDWAWLSQCVYCGDPKNTHVRGKCLFSSTNYKARNAAINSNTKDRRARGVVRKRNL